jgi:hypothetical protein
MRFSVFRVSSSTSGSVHGRNGNGSVHSRNGNGSVHSRNGNARNVRSSARNGACSIGLLVLGGSG